MNTKFTKRGVIKAKEASMGIYFSFSPSGVKYQLFDTWREGGLLVFKYANAKDFMPRFKEKRIDPETEITLITIG